MPDSQYSEHGFESPFATVSKITKYSAELLLPLYLFFRLTISSAVLLFPMYYFLRCTTSSVVLIHPLNYFFRCTDSSAELRIPLNNLLLRHDKYFSGDIMFWYNLCITHDCSYDLHRVTVSKRRHLHTFQRHMHLWLQTHRKALSQWVISSRRFEHND